MQNQITVSIYSHFFNSLMGEKMKIKIFENRKQALVFARENKGSVEWFQKPAIRKVKSKKTGRKIDKPIIKTFFRVTY